MKHYFIIKRSLFFICLLVYPFLIVESQYKMNNGENLSLLFIGDIMGHDEQIWSAENRETHTYNYFDVLKYIKPYIAKSDLAIANLEVTLAGPPYSGYPRFSSPASLAVACLDAGIDCLVTANNHSADRGKKGITSTIFKLDSLGIMHTGTFYNQLARDTLSPLIINRKGLKLALLNYTYGTNGIRLTDSAMINFLDKELINNDIKKAQQKKADIIILSLHWGTEYDTIPGNDQTDLANWLFSKGVDIIIGSHPHVIQKMVWVQDTTKDKNNIAVYSLGNFVSNQRKPRTDGGIMVKIDIKPDKDGCHISQAGYYLTWVYTPIVNYRKKFYILPCAEFEHKPGFFSDPKDYLQMKKFVSSSRTFLNSQNINFSELTPEKVDSSAVN